MKGFASKEEGVATEGALSVWEVNNELVTGAAETAGGKLEGMERKGGAERVKGLQDVARRNTMVPQCGGDGWNRKYIL